MARVDGKSEIPWSDGNFWLILFFIIPSDDSTTAIGINLDDIAAQDENNISTIIIIVVAAIVTITILFAIAVFIDCRQQKLTNARIKKSKKILKSIIPKLTKTEDEDALAEKMQDPELTGAGNVPAFPV